MSSILIIDDEDKYYELCRRFIPDHDFLEPARNYRQAEERLATHRASVDLVLLDVHFDIPEEELLPNDKGKLPEGRERARAVERLRRAQGLHILDRLRQTHPDLPVIVMTSRNDLPLEADAERLRAEDYTYLLDDDYLDARSLKLQIEGILARAERTPSEDEPFYWGSTTRMATLRRRLTILARGRLPIILLGATGTGKSLLAREFIHPRSERAGPFVAVDLATVPSDLMAAHLFGVVKGAFTGATTTREGVLARAHGGTLFLDEIGNLGLELQKSLLLVLQEGRYRPVGSVEEKTCEIKLVVATNEDLAVLVRHGKFREDLYMRLNPATAMRLPGLVERRDDFAALLDRFVRRVVREPYNHDLLAQYAAQRGLLTPEDGTPIPVAVGREVPPRADPRRVYFMFHQSSYNMLNDFSWPGNFRQFEMLLSNLVTLTLVDLVERAEEVEPENPGHASRPEVIPILPRTLRDLLRPMEPPPADDLGEDDGGEAPGLGLRVNVSLEPQESLNAVSCEVERQYLEFLYRRYNGDLAKLAELLLRDPHGGRKIQLRMNQLGIKLRSLKRRRGP